jgi:hypothetical protein
MAPAPDPEAQMLAISMEDFVNNLVDWLPQKLVHPAEILVYMVFLSILMLAPFVLWLGYAIATTKRPRRQELPTPPQS